MSADDVRGAWARIDGWLNASFPSLAELLRPPADDAQLARAAAALGATFPEELIASFGVHDGQVMAGEVLGDWALLSSDILPEVTAFLRGIGARPQPPEVEAALAVPGVRPGWWRDGWVPWAKNGGGDYLVIDTDPAPGGQLGQVLLYLHDLDRRDVAAPSIAAWLNTFADDLEADRYEIIGDALYPRDLDD